ncbi:pirin family protein [Pontibacter sp. MBLB2868]|uniref:pirin family protein n=1 Tax=Pontibacter sp. MBLB2868 TaxID=3451555 RepID=UPI003F753139
MIKLITASERHQANVGDWLSSHYLFSFADYYDPANVQYGPLRVFNDDHMQAKSELPAHPHAEMEVLTIVLDGEIMHKDSLGNEEKLQSGQVQRITAGTGITHSLVNEGDQTAHFYQLWFLPNKKGLAPSYELMKIDFMDNKDQLTPLVTGQKVLEDVVFMNSNSTVYFGNVSQGKDIDFKTFKIRKTLLYVTEGSLLVNNIELDKNDQIRLEDFDIISIHGAANASFILIDVPALEVNY